MKIKQLHLRNIASIERADIDFEHDLVDPITGEQARTFLIAGNTGAGKSAILDGIAMALYKNTPRLAGVENRNNNNYTNTDGENISVNSIEQYTRLGISPKDECYSEVVFESNDGLECRARLTLGIYLGRTDADGQRHLKHNMPKWEAKMGSEDWVNVDNKTGEPILTAIGLNFKQFGQMAMLAQGQFAAFLTGNKKERELILEQLTNTAQFYEYGEAIKNLYAQAKVNRKTVEVKLKAEKEHTMAEEEVKQLNDQLTLLTEQQKAEAEKRQQLEGQITVLKNYLAAKDEKEQLNKQLTEYRLHFKILSADILYRQQQLQKADSYIQDLQTWLKNHEEREGVYSQVDLISERLKQWRKKKDDGRRLAEGLEAENKKTTLLERTKNVADEDLKTSKQKVEALQELIDQLQGKLSALHPEEIVQQMDVLHQRKEALQQLQTLLHRLQEDRAEAQQLKLRMHEAQLQIDKQKEKLKQAYTDYTLADENNKKAQALLQTMKMSMDDKIMELRKRLHDEHADTCPLCGQPLTDHLMDTDFSEILSPLQQHQATAQQALSHAHDLYLREKGVYDRQNGELQTWQTAADKADQANKTTEEKIKALARSCALEGKSLADEIPSVITAMDQKMDELKQQQKQVESLRKQIDQILEDKKPLDVDYRKAIAQQGECVTALTRHLEMLKNMKQQIETITHDVEVLDTQLHTHLDRWYADWQIQIDETTLRLKADAKEYGDKKGNLDRARARSYQLQLCMEQILKTQQDVTILYADWNTDALEPKSYGTEDMINVWTKFYALVKSHAERVRTVNDILKNEYQGLDMSTLVKQRDDLSASIQKRAEQMGGIQTALQKNQENRERLALITQEMQQAEKRLKKWDIINKYFGGTKFRTLVQSYILRPLLNNANVYLRQITDRYELTCSEENEQLSILVLDRYNKNQVRSATVLSGGERFMISLSLSLALSSLNRPDMNVNILFIDEGFGTLDEKSLDSVMETLEKLQDIAGQNHRRVGIISHREELYDRIPVKIEVRKKGEGRSFISTT